MEAGQFEHKVQLQGKRGSGAGPLTQVCPLQIASTIHTTNIYQLD